MTLGGRAGRWPGGESGFTLAEVLVAMVMMVMVLSALYAIFDMSIKVFRSGGDRLLAIEGARLGLQRMEREIRAAYPYSRAETPLDGGPLFKVWDPDRLVFGNDLNGDGSIEPGEVIGYYRGEQGALIRAEGGGRQSVAAPVPSAGLKFSYCRSAGDCPPSAPPVSEREIRLVRISLTVEVDGRAQTLETLVSLRNR